MVRFAINVKVPSGISNVELWKKLGAISIFSSFISVSSSWPYSRTRFTSNIRMHYLTAAKMVVRGICVGKSSTRIRCCSSTRTFLLVKWTNPNSCRSTIVTLLATFTGVITVQISRKSFFSSKLISNKNFVIINRFIYLLI